MTRGALTGTRVLDLSRVLGGPSCGQIFADLGPKVIKVEDRGGDENRNWLPVVEGRDAGLRQPRVRCAGRRGRQFGQHDIRSAQG